MPKINNSDVVQKLIDECGLYPGVDVIPTQLAEKVVPVFTVNKEEIDVTVVPETATIVRSDYQGVAGSSTLYTVPSTGEFYLTGANWFVDNDGTANTTMVLNIVVDGTTVELFNARFINGHAGNQAAAHDFSSPILLTAGSNITITTSNSAGDIGATIIGYTKA